MNEALPPHKKDDTTMNLLIDMGNTRTKWMLADDRWQLMEGGVYEGDWASVPHLGDCTTALLCATGRREDELQQLATHGIGVVSFADLFFQQQHGAGDAGTPATLPVIAYRDKERTLGQDRIAALCGAWERRHTACVVIDAGTCITVDYIDGDGLFAGGAIMASPELQLHAMHQHTARLPEIDIDYALRYTLPYGDNTADAMLAGTVTATATALHGFIDHYRRLDTTQQTSVIITGGIGLFMSRMIADAEYVEDLVFHGMATVGRQLATNSSETIKSLRF